MKIHVVQKGDTLWTIAKNYQVSFEELKAVNTQLADPDMIMPGMKIKIPAGKSVEKEEYMHPYANNKPAYPLLPEDFEMPYKNMVMPKAVKMPEIPKMPEMPKMQEVPKMQTAPKIAEPPKMPKAEPIKMWKEPEQKYCTCKKAPQAQQVMPQMNCMPHMQQMPQMQLMPQMQQMPQMMMPAPEHHMMEPWCHPMPHCCCPCHQPYPYRGPF
ncbi:hypothetical protein KP77_03320 [Jeotgalibacillus alimentarius]|uniref:LysM domain-containing protein n=1 Tax=Jeotgalibacillus alimentarius TaxID=135826 RepID=A0A0C2W9T9_9BACL|nr:SafA/ExsA family spore coat assembly protein [Jeotgalibacillus alimentarius]KIL53356.1 hypothetical protein KP77_03320 [Jeotgalibacillus alimentarius]